MLCWSRLSLSFSLSLSTEEKEEITQRWWCHENNNEFDVARMASRLRLRLLCESYIDHFFFARRLDLMQLTRDFRAKSSAFFSSLCAMASKSNRARLVSSCFCWSLSLWRFVIFTVVWIVVVVFGIRFVGPRRMVSASFLLTTAFDFDSLLSPECWRLKKKAPVVYLWETSVESLKSACSKMLSRRHRRLNRRLEDASSANHLFPMMIVFQSSCFDWRFFFFWE